MAIPRYIVRELNPPRPKPHPDTARAARANALVAYYRMFVSYEDNHAALVSMLTDLCHRVGQGTFKDAATAALAVHRVEIQ